MVNDRLVKPLDGYFSRVDTSKPQIGVVKNNVDPEYMGRLQVWIKGSTAPENDPNGWVWVNYCSPFAGATSVNTLGNNPKNADSTQRSYGFWAVPPDQDNEVLVMFVNGDIRNGYWIGCMFHKNMNHMVPGVPASNSFQSPEERFQNNALPVCEYNKLGSSSDSRRPFFSALAEGLMKQGLLTDDIRGPGSSGARRESPSKVFGMLSPGGNQFVMDDGEGSELIRFRTKSGAQIVISETFGNIYIISRDGNSWMELNNDGYIDVYSEKDMSIRSQLNVNIRADQDINLEAGNNINLRASGPGIQLNATTGKININAEESAHITSKSSTNIRSLDSAVIIKGEVGTYVQSIDPIRAAVPTASVKTDKKSNYSSNSGRSVQNVNTQTIATRLPHVEPWEDHSELITSTRNTVEEDSGVNVSKGNVVEQASDPLPVVGKPKAGMPEGAYEPKGYKGDEPLYEFISPSTDLVPVNELQISDAGLAFIAAWEKFVPDIYKDAAGLPTIGYGHLIKSTTPDYAREGPITKEQATELLRADAEIAASEVRKRVTVKLTQPQFDALVSFTFNVGNGAFRKSTLLKRLNAENYADVPTQLMRWVKAGGRTLRGLQNRRRAEGLMFARGKY